MAVIRSFKNTNTGKVWNREHVRSLGPELQRAAERPEKGEAIMATTAKADDRFWINIQTDYDLEVERDLHADELANVTALVAS